MHTSTSARSRIDDAVTGDTAAARRHRRPTDAVGVGGGDDRW
ncbi:hypothetical protein [Halovivax cerinus]|uniref:Uncharacterized protein n=1 Tax=Halovivax cerinus TaxID=1487865 RepID=A0ABD5NTA5_9EURY|nr:hypothetical protein [Halovivax cerinus]